MGRFHLFQPFVVEMELSLLLLEALDEWGMSPLLVLAITVHEVATTLCYPSYSSFERVNVSLCESDCLHEVVHLWLMWPRAPTSTHIGIAFQPFSRSL